ncbi:hypothetical protein JB92DRAFT_3105323 [Gautieria morchelliformis]|nr:hypothetical protein JB92DRAFT_3105323 [Gautieria morchelliformis]
MPPARVSTSAPKRPLVATGRRHSTHWPGESTQPLPLWLSFLITRGKLSSASPPPWLMAVNRRASDVPNRLVLLLPGQQFSRVHSIAAPWLAHERFADQPVSRSQVLIVSTSAHLKRSSLQYILSFFDPQPSNSYRDRPGATPMPLPGYFLLGFRKQNPASEFSYNPPC